MNTSRILIGKYFREESLGKAQQELIKLENKFMQPYALIKCHQGYIIVSVKTLKLLAN